LRNFSPTLAALSEAVATSNQADLEHDDFSGADLTAILTAVNDGRPPATQARSMSDLIGSGKKLPHIVNSVAAGGKLVTDRTLTEDQQREKLLEQAKTEFSDIEAPEGVEEDQTKFMDQDPDFVSVRRGATRPPTRLHEQRSSLSPPRCAAAQIAKKALEDADTSFLASTSRRIDDLTGFIPPDVKQAAKPLLALAMQSVQAVQAIADVVTAIKDFRKAAFGAVSAVGSPYKPSSQRRARTAPALVTLSAARAMR